MLVQKKFVLKNWGQKVWSKLGQILNGQMSPGQMLHGQMLFLCIVSTGCTLFVQAVTFKPKIAGGWYYTLFEAHHSRLKTSTHTSHICL